MFNFNSKIPFKINTFEDYFKTLQFKNSIYYFNKKKELQNLYYEYQELLRIFMFFNNLDIYKINNEITNIKIDNTFKNTLKNNFKSILNNFQKNELIDIKNNLENINNLIEILDVSENKEDYEKKLLQFEFFKEIENNYIINNINY